MSSPTLAESTIKDICDELSQRNVNFILIANYYETRREDEHPVISFGVRRQDLTKAIGMLETSKSYLIDEFTMHNDVEHSYEDFDEDDFDEDFDENFEE